MVVYTCQRCWEYTTHINTHYDRHISRKFPCKKNPKPVNSKSTIIKPAKKHECKYCKKCFSKNSHMHRHIRPHSPFPAHFRGIF